MVQGSRLAGQKGAWHPKKLREIVGGGGGVGECISESGRVGMAGGGTGVGPPGKGPGKRSVGPGSPAKAAGGVAGWNALTTEVVTAESRLGHTQGGGGAA